MPAVICQYSVCFLFFVFLARVALDEDDDDAGPPSDDEDEEDYEPTDEDSDWQPGKDEEEKEDVDELLKEAKRFMRRKK